MEEVDSDRNGSNNVPATMPQRDVSVGCWKGETGMAEITVKRGKLWGSMGVIRNSKLYCHVEEAVYMVEQGSLLLLREDDNKPISCQEVYDLLVIPSYGCSWDSYQIFCHLKRLGYIVGRHGTPWTTSWPKGSPREALPESGPEVDLKLRGALHTKVSSNTIPCKDVDEGSLRQDRDKDRGEELSWSKSEKLCVEGTRKVLAYLFRSLRLSKEEDTEKALDTKEEQRGLKIMFDVHLPNGRFKKTVVGFPTFSLCVINGQEPPEQRQVRDLEAKIGGRALKFGIVDCGHVSIFSFCTCSLPVLP